MTIHSRKEADGPVPARPGPRHLSLARGQRVLLGASAVLGAFALVAATVAASPTPGQGPSPTATGRPVGTSGCGQAPSPASTAGGPGDVVQSLAVDAATRSYRLAVPVHYHRDSPTPLILLFHGSGSNAVQTSVYTELPARASRAGFLVATPDAVGGNWQLSAPDAHSADLEFTAALIASLSARFCVDRTRIYAAGISLGSEFSAIVACAVPHRIAAVGLVAAEFPLHPCVGPIPVLAFHGTADPLVPYANGGTGKSFPGLPLPGAEHNLAGWARLDGCDPTPRLGAVGTEVVRREWVGCRSGSAVILYTVVGGGHTWPGSPITLPPAFGPTTHQVDATGRMLAFFGQHRGQS